MVKIFVLIVICGKEIFVFNLSFVVTKFLCVFNLFSLYLASNEFFHANFSQTTVVEFVFECECA